jgi:hypothetical protein
MLFGSTVSTKKFSFYALTRFEIPGPGRPEDGHLDGRLWRRTSPARGASPAGRAGSRSRCPACRDRRARQSREQAETTGETDEPG